MERLTIPFVDLKAQYLSIKREVDEAIENVIAKSSFIGGDYVKSFERNFSAYVGARHCIGVGNGTDALAISLKCAGVKSGDEVITAANTFIATSEAITLAGGRPVFVDCDPVTFNIDAQKIEERITERTKAIVPVHLYGQPADMEGIGMIAKKHNLRVIEDAAQAHGASLGERKVGTLGDCACFSFFPGKNLGAYGDGGAVVTDNDDLAKMVRMYANHGRLDKFGHEFEGTNSRLDGLQAAILDVKLKHLEEWTARRIAVAGAYDRGLAGICVTPEKRAGVKHVYHLYVIRVKEREKVKAALEERGIATGIHYPIPLPYLKAYEYMRSTPEDYPVSYSMKDQILSIPMHGSMTEEHVSYVIDQIKNVLGF
ncbi:MAG TPA: DegT/DnrJ/EryC1/StrS family aminotransferase [Syntrophorhabdaceae bacterium]|jgi:dTDP-4-amino-4,6-dideoxygalactose transaminase